jgi:hypothetical protein
MNRCEHLAVNVDRLVGHRLPGRYLKIKSRTWSRKEASTRPR